MPVYPHKCASCAKSVEEVRKVADYDKAPICCGVPMPRVYTVPMVRPDIAPFRSPVDGQWIDGRSQRAEYMRRNGLQDAGDRPATLPVAMPKPVIDSEAIAEAVAKVEAGYKPAPSNLTLETLSEPA